MAPVGKCGLLNPIPVARAGPGCGPKQRRPLLPVCGRGVWSPEGGDCSLRAGCPLRLPLQPRPLLSGGERRRVPAQRFRLPWVLRTQVLAHLLARSELG